MPEQSPSPHLVHVTPGFGIGGAQVRTTQIINHLGASFRHTILSLNGEIEALRRIDSGVSVHGLTCPLTSNPLAMALRLRKEFQRLRPDLVLTYNFGSLDAINAVALGPQVPVVHTEDGFGPDEAVQQKTRRIWLRRLLLRGASRVVAPSLVLSRVMRDAWRLPPARLVYIPNGVDTSRLQPAPASQRRDGRLVIGTVGGLRPEKQHVLLLDIVTELMRTAPVRLVIAGDGPERLPLEERARALGIGDVVEFLGHREDLPAVYRRLDVFVLTSSTEQMPLSVLEAMACGLPVVSTPVGDVPQMLSAENRALVASGNTALVQALRSLMADPAGRSRIGAANRRHCLETYGLDRMLARYEELYRSLLTCPEGDPYGKGTSYANQADLCRGRSA